MANINFSQITTPGGYQPGGGSGVAAYTNPLEKIISNSLAILTIVGGLAFTLWFLMGGLNWITAGGKKDKIENAKNMMTNGAIGMIIITVSYSIVWIVGKALGVDILNPGTLIQSMTFK